MLGEVLPTTRWVEISDATMKNLVDLRTQTPLAYWNLVTGPQNKPSLTLTAPTAGYLALNVLRMAPFKTLGTGLGVFGVGMLLGRIRRRRADRRAVKRP